MEKIFDGETYKKIFFRLQKDESNYPPDDWEILWGKEIGNELFSIDSVPFFIRGVSWGNVVSADQVEDKLCFRMLVHPSGHSVLRVIVFDESEVAGAREMLQQMGCDTEQSHIPKLLSVDVPPSVSLQSVIKTLAKGEEEGRWEYEEACIAAT